MANPAMLSNLRDQVWLQKQLCIIAVNGKNGKYKLTIWPYHGMLGSEGHALAE